MRWMVANILTSSSYLLPDTLALSRDVDDSFALLRHQMVALVLAVEAANAGVLVVGYCLQKALECCSAKAARLEGLEVDDLLEVEKPPGVHPARLYRSLKCVQVSSPWDERLFSLSTPRYESRASFAIMWCSKFDRIISSAEDQNLGRPKVLLADDYCLHILMLDSAQSSHRVYPHFTARISAFHRVLVQCANDHDVCPLVYEITA